MIKTLRGASSPSGCTGLRGLAGVWLVLTVTATPQAQTQDLPPPINELDRIVAVVNDDVIVLSELDSRLRTVRRQLTESGTQPPSDPVLARQVLDRLILDRLQLQVANQTGVRVDDETLNQAVSRLAEQNNLNLGQFRSILERDGYDFGKFREELRNELLIARLRQRQIQNRVVVSDRDIDNFLGNFGGTGLANMSFQIGHILVAVPEAASPEQIALAKRRAGSVLDTIRNGEDFARVAVAESDGQQALKGGNLGWRKADQLPTAFADVVPSMQVGDVSEPIRSPSGFHLVKLIEKRGDEQSFITQARARHILIRPNELVPDEQAQRRLLDLKERIENQANFAELARAHSDDPGSATRGGELGWVSPGDVVPEFERQMDQLAENQVSEPFRTQFGWHIVQVTERRRQDNTDQVRRAKAAERIRERKIEDEMQTWLRQLRDEAFVEYRLDEQ